MFSLVCERLGEIPELHCLAKESPDVGFNNKMQICFRSSLPCEDTMKLLKEKFTPLFVEQGFKVNLRVTAVGISITITRPDRILLQGGGL